MNLPRDVDWVKEKVVTFENDKGSRCNAGWAFAAIGALEGRWLLKTKGDR